MANFEQETDFLSSLMGLSPSGTDSLRGILELVNNRSLLFHGFGKKTNGRQRLEGIRPLAPEGQAYGNSYWAHGTRLFVAGRPGSFTTFDTPFFHYGPKQNPNGKPSHHLAVANAEELLDNGIIQVLPENKSGEFTIQQTVPAALLTLVECYVDPIPDLSVRENMQLLERTALASLNCALQNI